MKLNFSFKIYHLAALVGTVLFICTLQYNALSSKSQKLSSGKKYQARDLEAVLQNLGEQKDFSPWKDASKIVTDEQKFALLDKKANSDEDLKVNEKLWMDSKNLMKGHWLTHPLTAGKLHIFYLTFPTADEAKHREIIRQHHKEWKQNSTGIIPISYRFVTLKISDKPTMAGIMHENDQFDDIIVTATMFNSQKDRKNVLLMNEAMKVAKKFLFDDFPIITKDLAQHQVALFCRSTDIINLKEIEHTIAQMNGPAAKVSNMISFGPKKPYGVNFRMVAHDYLVTPISELLGEDKTHSIHHHSITRVTPMTCGYKIMIRCDKLGDYSDLLDDAWEDVKYSNNTEEILKLFTGIIRLQAGIQAITPNSFSHAILTLPFENAEYNSKYNVDVMKKWALDMKPPAVMKHEIPPVYMKNIESLDDKDDKYKRVRTDLIRDTPECPNEPVLALITTSRKNFDERNLFRLYRESIKQTPQNPYYKDIPMLFLIGLPGANENVNVTKRLDLEIKEHGDFIMGGYEDKYDNLSFKTLSAYDYVVNHCKGQENPKRIFFQDDDSFLVVDKVTKMMQNSTLAPITCLAGFNDESRPFRFGKYNLTFTEWETGYWFPSFCAGPCSAMERSTVKSIYDTAMKSQELSFKLEDVFFTGVLRQKANVKPPADMTPNKICDHLGSKNAIAQRLERYVAHTKNESLSMVLNEYLPYKRKELIKAKIPEYANKQLGIDTKPEIVKQPEENHAENSL